MNIDSTISRSVGGIWYVPHDAEKVYGRSINADLIADFCRAIHDGHVVVLHSGRSIAWEAIPNVEAAQLP